MSTAALMHDQRSESEALYELDNVPFAYHVREDEYRVTLTLVSPEHKWDALSAVMIHKPRAHWSGRIDPANVSLSASGYMDALTAAAIGQLLEIAAWACTFANGDAAEQIQKQKEAQERAEAERAERRERELAERQAREAEHQAALAKRYAAVDELIETLKWMLEEECRLKYTNKRSTIFAKRIVEVREFDPSKPSYQQRRSRQMEIVTERGKDMTIDLTRIEWLEIQDPETAGTGKRTKWDRIFPAASAETDEQKEN